MKKLIVALVVVLALALVVPAAFAAVTPEKQQEIDNLTKQMFEIRKQLVDKYVEAGEITKEQGEAIKQRIDYMEKNYKNFGGRPGLGRGFGGCGMGGFGACGGVCWGNANPNTGNAQNSASNTVTQ